MPNSNGTIERLYNFVSKIPFFWEIDSIVCRATEKSPYRSVLIDKLNLSEGSKVLDMACGTGLNFRLLEEKIGAGGSITAVDNSEKTLALAKKRIAVRKYDNITISKSSGDNFKSPVIHDAALCTFAIEIIPPYKETLRTMIDAVKNSGRIGIIGFKLSSKTIIRYFNKPFQLSSVSCGIDLNRDVLTYLRNNLNEVYYKDAFGGFYYCAVFEKPGDVS
jgi:ubiquinone/menaquinone biosynthesis C-methylase UbiE